MAKNKSQKGVYEEMEDITGKTFGKWAVIKRAKNSGKDPVWECSCECGTIKNVRWKYLKSGKSKSCGCTHLLYRNREDYIGEKHGSLTIVDLVYEGKTYFMCRCDCGNVINILPSSFKKQKSCGCSRFKTYEGKKYGKLLIKKMLYNYKNGFTYCLCDCDCGNKGIIIRCENIVSGNTKSCGCTKKESLIGEKYGRLSVIKESSKNNKNQRQWICVCDCGQIVCLTTHTLKTGHTLSCGCLRSESVSYHEMFISNILRESGIDFYTEKSFDSCVGLGGKPLRFDFYIPDSNLLIEYDGEQHFRPIKYFNGTAGFDRLKKNEKIKEEFCKKNNIQLLRLPYTMTDEEIKKEILSRIP